MKLYRFFADRQNRWGIRSGDLLEEIAWDSEENYERYRLTGNEFSFHDSKLLAPCCPSKVIGIGLNYKSHAEEVKMPLPDQPVIFLKPSTAIIGPGDSILLPNFCRRVDYEAEIGVVVGKRAKDVPVEEAGNYILGYTCSNDVTARDFQKKEGQWSYSKGFDTFAPIGPCIETEVVLNEQKLTGSLNGEIVQQSPASDLIFSVEHLFSYISFCMTLLPGDVIMTGTPSGIGRLKDGDIFEVEVTGVGKLQNKAEASS